MMRDKQIEAELRLFKSYTLDEYDKIDDLKNNTISIQKCILYSDVITNSIKNIAEKMYGINAEQLNATFHKSFGTILDTPIETLVAQQILHYFTTYGLESLGLDNSGLVYIPKEKLEIPKLESDIVLTYIRAINIDELKERILSLVNSGIALSEQTIEDIMSLSDFIDKKEISNIKNREIKIGLYDKYGIVPDNNMEFLRYIVYKLTNSPLFIKNTKTIKTIKGCDRELVFRYLNQYISKENGYKKLAEIFLRNKNIFLAFKTKSISSEYEKDVNSIINKISKLAKKYHKPITKNILDRLTEINTIKLVNKYKDNILEALDNISIYREIRIINGLKYRISVNSLMNNKLAIAYRIRNGKIYASKMKKINAERILNARNLCYDLIYNHLIQRLTPYINGKVFCIPNNVTYTLPTSEKQFVGNIPEGSYVEIKRENNMVFGVHWFNVNNKRVDLDLKLLSRTNTYGWNADYLSDTGDIIFSGDMTDAPEPYGATEVFLIKPSYKNSSFLVKLNDFTQVRTEIPFEFFISKSEREQIYKDYAVDPNKVLLKVPNKFTNQDSKISTPAKTIGYIKINEENIQFIFKNFDDVKGRVSEMNSVNEILFNYSENYNNIQLTLNQIIEKCGGTIINEPSTMKFEPIFVTPEQTLYNKVLVKANYNLNLEVISKDTITKILEGK